MDYTDIYGHKNIINTLKKVVKNNSVSHAYLFSGQKGLGKKLVAKAFAKTLLCKTGNDIPCNKCSSCIKFDSGNHPDFYIETPLGESFKKEQIDNIQNNLKTLPYESKRKVFILDDCDKMTVAAQNSFLKTLEEPPEHSVIIMICINSYSLLPTISSRCQIIKFSLINSKEIEKAIIDRFNVDINESKFISNFSNGIIGKAFDLYNNEFKKIRNELIDIIDYVMECDKFQVFSKVEYFENNKDNIYDIMDMTYIWFRDLVVLKESNLEDIIINKDKIDLLNKQVRKISRYKLYEILDTIKNTKDNLASKVNFTLSIEMMLLKFQEVKNG